MKPSLPIRRIVLMSMAIFASLPAAKAGLRLPAIISDHMILQRSAQSRLWGTDAPGSHVRASLGALEGEAVADSTGHWSMELDVRSLKEGPWDLKIEGSTKTTISDVLIGEVWLFSGQSNMAYTLDRSTGGAEEIAHSLNPRLRQFSVAYNPIASPQENCKGAWKLASPQDSAGFTAVGYYFGKDLQKGTGSPVGLIRSAWAGTQILCWIGEDALATVPELKEMNETAKQRAAAYPKLKEEYVPAVQKWETDNGRADAPSDPAAFAASDAATTGWNAVTLHNTKFRTVGLPDAGVVWLRQKITLPANTKPEKGASLSLITGAFDQTYWNGVKIGEMNETNCPGPSASRFYKIPPELCHEGENVVAIRTFTPTDEASFGSAYVDVGVSRLHLSDKWEAKTEKELPPLAKRDYPVLPNAPGISPGALYNGMIHPLAQLTIAGVVWYQGEQDTGRKGSLYGTMLKTLVTNWRAHFGDSLPFIICQLPNFSKKTATPGNSTWASIREAQRLSLAIPRTSLVTTIDTGDEDVHPPNKKPVGERVALAALAQAYGKSEASSGPLFEAMKIEGDHAVLSFHGTDGGLSAKPLPATYRPSYASKADVPLPRNSPDSQLEGFAIKGENNRWVWAQAKIQGETVVVWSPEVPKPVAVRYAWADNPTANLYNGAGLPASPFQTDSLE